MFRLFDIKLRALETLQDSHLWSSASLFFLIMNDEEINDSWNCMEER